MFTNEPKLATAAGEAERVVRDLLDAFNSLKAIPAPPTCSPPAEEKRPVQVQEGCEQGSEPVKGNAPSDIGEQEPEQNLALKGAAISEPSDHQIEAPKTRDEIIEEARLAHEVVERLKMTPNELRAPSHESMFGSSTCKQDELLVRRQIRQAPNPAKPRATAPPKPLYVCNYKFEPSIPGTREIAEHLRRAALARLAESDSLMGVGRSTLRQVGAPVLSTLRQFGALVLIAAMTWGCIGMMVILGDHLWRKPIPYSLLSVELVWPKPTLSSLLSVELAGHFKALLCGEILLAASTVVIICLRWKRSRSESKIRN